MYIYVYMCIYIYIYTNKSHQTKHDTNNIETRRPPQPGPKVATDSEPTDSDKARRKGREIVTGQMARRLSADVSK